MNVATLAPKRRSSANFFACRRAGPLDKLRTDYKQKNGVLYIAARKHAWSKVAAVTRLMCASACCFSHALCIWRTAGCGRVEQPGDDVRHDRRPGRHEGGNHGYCEDVKTVLVGIGNVHQYGGDMPSRCHTKYTPDSIGKAVHLT